MGRDKRNEKRSEHWTKMLRPTMQTDAWRALSTTSQALYPWLKLEWRGPENNNNGKLRLSVRQASNCLGVSLNTASKAFHDLQAKGFLVITERAVLGSSGDAKSAAYELTEIALPHANGQPRALYKQWKPKHDYPVHKSLANNPAGRNGRKKTCHRNEDSNVIKIKTVAAGSSSN